VSWGISKIRDAKVQKIVVRYANFGARNVKKNGEKLHFSWEEARRDICEHGTKKRDSIPRKGRKRNASLTTRALNKEDIAQGIC